MTRGFKEAEKTMQITQGVSVGLAALRRNKLRSVLTTLGIVIGIATVVAVVSLGGGAEQIVLAELEKVGGASMIICFRPSHIKREDGVYVRNKTTEQLEFEDGEFILETCPNITNVLVTSGGSDLLVRHKRTDQSLQVEGVTPAFQDVQNWYVEHGRFLSDNDIERRDTVCVIGSKVRKDLFHGADPLGLELKIGDERFTVIGVMEEKGSALWEGGWDSRVVIPFSTMRTRFLNPGWPGVSYIRVQAASYEQVDKALMELKVALRQRHVSEKYFEFFTLKEIIKQLGTTSRTIQILLGGVAALALFVGGIGIMNIMLVSVTERTGEIGLRKAIGAKRRDILIQFLIESIVLSLCGGFIGIVIGVGLIYGVVGILTTFVLKGVTWPAVVSVQATLIAFSVSACIGIFFGLYPANKAANLMPTEALRHE